MKLLILFFMVMLTPFGFSQSNYNDSLNSHRENHVRDLFNLDKRILNTDDLKHLDTVLYYAVDEQYIIKVRFTKDKGRKFKMPTSTARTPIYRRYGYLDFTIRDTNCRLTVFQNMELKNKEEYKNYFFIPFRDETSGITSYGGGRYIDVYINGNELVKSIDFNFNYNPYCAYSHR